MFTDRYTEAEIKTLQHRRKRQTDRVTDTETVRQTDRQVDMRSTKDTALLEGMKQVCHGTLATCSPNSATNNMQSNTNTGED